MKIYSILLHDYLSSRAQASSSEEVAISLSQMAEKMRTDKGAILRALKALEQEGIVSKEGFDSQRTRIYKIHKKSALAFDIGYLDIFPTPIQAYIYHIISQYKVIPSYKAIALESRLNEATIKRIFSALIAQKHIKKAEPTNNRVGKFVLIKRKMVNAC